MKKSNRTDNTYYGIGDAHGLESINPAKSIVVNHLHMRAMSNRHRHAVVFRVELTDAEFAVLDKLSRLDAVGALQQLKLHPNLEIEQQFTNSWEMIPNSKLDPYYGGAG